MQTPYTDLPPTAFWRSAVAETEPDALRGLYLPKTAVHAEDAIATAGSCFARHIGRVLRQAGVRVVDAEPAPSTMPVDVAQRFGYGQYAARYGNIYSTRQFVQLLQDALDMRVRDDGIWQDTNRFHDALRPTVEPDGLDSQAEVIALRYDHLARVRHAVQATDVFIFTAGLTEVWEDRASGTVYPVCPGVIAGQFDGAKHRLLRLDFPDIMADLAQAHSLLQQMRPGIKLILTVSPVPLTATASDAHVLAATVRSKAILRAATGSFADRHTDVDYFPSYEVITNPAARGRYFGVNLRDVTSEGVAAVMSLFMSAHGLGTRPLAPSAPMPANAEADSQFCEDALLDAFVR